MCYFFFLLSWLELCFLSWISIIFFDCSACNQLYIYIFFLILRDRYHIATKKDKILASFMIILAVFSNLVAIYSDAYALFKKGSSKRE